MHTCTSLIVGLCLLALHFRSSTLLSLMHPSSKPARSKESEPTETLAKHSCIILTKVRRFRFPSRNEEKGKKIKDVFISRFPLIGRTITGANAWFKHNCYTTRATIQAFRISQKSWGPRVRFRSLKLVEKGGKFWESRSSLAFRDGFKRDVRFMFTLGFSMMETRVFWSEGIGDERYFFCYLYRF